MQTIFCKAALNYAGAGPTDVAIHDGRHATELPGWEECGFQLVHHPSKMSDWGDEDELVSVHHPEMAALAKEMTGADRALVAAHIKRGPEHAARHRDLGPITLVHSDFADSYRDNVVENHPEAAEARRLVILQFWRNLGPAKMDLPLAFCDARTVPKSEVRAFPVSNYAGSGGLFEALAVTGGADHHDWYTFPELQRDEVVAFRTYDSDRIDDGRPYWTPHSAFRDPDVDLGRPARSSIELRASCLFF